MKLTVKDTITILDALEVKMNSLEWDIRKYDDEGNRIPGEWDETSESYPKYMELKKLIEKLGKTEL